MGDKKAEKKRKAAPTTTSPSAKKSKKDATAAAVMSKKATAAPVEAAKSKPSVLPNAETGKKEKVPRKRAADFMEDESDEEAGWAGFEDKDKKGSKKAKKTKATGESAVKEKKKKEKEAVKEPTPEMDVVPLEEESEEEDQTATLLKGFESSDDESDDGAPEEKGRGDLSKQGLPNPEKTKKKLEAAKPSKEPGIVTISRIPHGFYEHEMRSYFSQFGEVTRLRLSRNKKTGRSKHYAFIEFASSEVAQIVAETMDNYLLFGHILKCKLVKEISPEDRERLFIGANKRFKAMPRAKMERRIHDKPRTEEEWKKREAKELARREQKAKKLKSLGIDYEFEVAKPVDVVVQEEKKVDEPKAAEEPAAAAAAPKKKGKKAKAITATGEKDADAALEASVKETIKESKKKTKTVEKAKEAVPVAADKKKKKKKSAK